ncbi:hypothetical protein M011DRAFT_491768 [Sporormia fimetaria CBS 119925]|uniref:DUF4360 domain-containing protein n=1 Tax=Sporormia fimetaria CBS 119925 TaxID=1340428 RepID=A0A6A6VNS1_9PLEO|nr:hypothetical protein M011DRAFT_491768 [Sporormia fimetaria CBS 119925]
MKYALSTLALAAFSFASPVPEAAEAALAPPAYKIKSVIHGGSGCPQDSAIDIDWTNSQVLPIRFPKEFTTAIGKGVPIDDSRKNCQINVALQFSPGFQYTIVGTDFSGFGDLDAGVTARVSTLYYFSGQTQEVTTALNLAGPWHGRFTKSDDIPLAIWSPCGSDAGLNINSAVALNGAGNGWIHASKESVHFSQALYIKWRRC